MIIDIRKIYDEWRITDSEYEKLVRVNADMRLAGALKEEPISEESTDRAKHEAECRDFERFLRRRGAFVPSVDGLMSLLHGVELTPEQAEVLQKTVASRVRGEAVTDQATNEVESLRFIGVFMGCYGCDEATPTHVIEFASNEEARAHLGKLTNEINRAVVGEIALVQIGGISVRPQDVTALEVWGV